MAWHGKSDTGVKSGALYAFPWYFRRILPRFQNLDFITDCFRVGDTPIFFIHTVCTTPVLLQMPAKRARHRARGKTDDGCQ
jgi:hypothetical protein